MLAGDQVRQLANLLITLAAYAEAGGRTDVANSARAFLAETVPFEDDPEAVKDLIGGFDHLAQKLQALNRDLRTAISDAYPVRASR